MTTADIVFDTMFAVNPCVVTLGGAQKTHDARKSDELLKRPQVAVDCLTDCCSADNRLLMPVATVTLQGTCADYSGITQITITQLAHRFSFSYCCC